MYYGSVSRPIPNSFHQIDEAILKEIDKCTVELLKYLGIQYSNEINDIQILMIHDDLEKKNAMLSLVDINAKTKTVNLIVNNKIIFRYVITTELKEEGCILTTKLSDLRGE